MLFYYLLHDECTRAAVIIDPVLEQVERDVALVKDLDLDLKLAINTHCHADHVTGSGELKKHFQNLKSAISIAAGCKADFMLTDNETVKFGNSTLQVLFTPGHTDGCASFYSTSLGAVFTGDTLLIRGCGRTDFQNGSARSLYRSVHKRLYKLPEETFVYPAHDYNGKLSSTIGEEKTSNPRLHQNEADFLATMRSLDLPFPKKMLQAVPRNIVCGV